MGDPARHLAGQLQRIGAADQQVPGVQAQRDLRTGQHAVDVAAGLAPSCRHAGAAPRARPAPLLRRPADRDWQAAWPTGRRRASGGSRIRRCRSPRPARERRPCRPPARRAGLRCRGSGSCPASCSRTGAKVPDTAQPKRIQQGTELVGIGRQEACRPQFGCGQAGVTHLGEYALRGELIAPPGHLAHPPGDRRAGELQGFHSDPHILDPYRDTALQ